MTELYTGAEYDAENAVKRRMMTVWYILLGIWLALSVAIVVTFALLPYGTVKTPFLVGDIALALLFWGYSYFFFSIKQFRQRKYVRMLRYINTGLRETDYGEFMGYDETLTVKEGVDFHYMILRKWNDKKQEYMERKVLLDLEKTKPDFTEGTRIKIETQGNILVAYGLSINKKSAQA